MASSGNLPQILEISSSLNDDNGNNNDDEQPIFLSNSVSMASTGKNPNANPNSNPHKSKSKSNLEWPTETAAAKMYMPMQWLCPPEDESTCTIQYDSTRQLLKVIDEQHSIIDIINPLDIIGVDVEIKLFDSATGNEFRGAFSNSTNREMTGPSSPAKPNIDAVTNTNECSIFDPLLQNDNHIFSFQRNDNDNELIPVDSQAAAVLNLYTYPKSNTHQSWFCRATNPHQPNPHYEEGDGSRFAKPYSFPVTPAHDFENITQLVKAIRRVALLPPTKPKYLVLINPKSGTGQAHTVWQKVAKRMLEKEAGVDITIIMTDYAGHAKELMQQESTKLMDYDGVICLGGDGVMHEILQGWQARPDFKQVLKKVRLGVLGCGTGNGLAKSLTFEAGERWGTLESTFLIARSQAIAIDLSKYAVADKTYTSFLTFTWAMIADIDIDSECIRFMGSARMDIWGFRCVVGMRKYRGRLSYLPPPPPSETKDVSKLSSSSIPMPLLSEPVPSDWEVIEDDILLLWASQVPYASQTNYNSPPSSLQDGVFHICLVRGKYVGRVAMASILIGLDTGSHAHHPNTEFIECVAYRLEPLCEGSYNDLDGEVIESGPIQAQVMPGALQIFGSSKQGK